MFGPGVYVPDPTEGIVAVKDLPAPQCVPYSRNGPVRTTLSPAEK